MPNILYILKFIFTGNRIPESKPNNKGFKGNTSHIRIVDNMHCTYIVYISQLLYSMGHRSRATLCALIINFIMFMQCGTGTNVSKPHDQHITCRITIYGIMTAIDTDSALHMHLGHILHRYSFCFTLLTLGHTSSTCYRLTPSNIHQKSIMFAFFVLFLLFMLFRKKKLKKHEEAKSSTCQGAFQVGQKSISFFKSSLTQKVHVIKETLID